MALSLLLAVLLSAPAAAQGFNSACFQGINDSDSPAVLSPCESPDLLNVESNLTGTAILKRKGYALSASLTVSTAAVTGSHSFIDSSGNRLDIVCNDKYCAKSTNGNAFANFLSTAGGSGTSPTRWSFVDIGGILYGANNKYDPILRYDGTTLSYLSGAPQGSILEATQDRMVVGDISGNPNRVYYSSSGAVEQFTVGVNSQDPFFDDVGAPGDRVRGLKYFHGNLYIFKTSSLTSCELADQYSTRCSVLIPNLGTTDPPSIITGGDSLYFRGQDKNYWEISRNGIKQISAKIPNLVKSQSGGLGGGENSNTQTTKSDWQAGTQNPTGTWDTATINGSIFPSSASYSDSISSVDWSMTDIDTSTYVTTYEDNFDDGQLTSPMAWTTCPSNAGFTADSSNRWMSPTISGSSNNCIYIADTENTGTWSFVFISSGSSSMPSFIFISDDTNPQIFNGYKLDLGGTTYLRRQTGTTVATLSSASISGITSNIEHTFKITRAGNGFMTVSHNGSVVISTSDRTYLSGALTNSFFVNNFGITPTDVGHILRFKTPSFYSNQVSMPFDTSFSTAMLGIYSVSLTSTNYSSVTFRTETSSATGGAWSGLSSVSNNAKPSSPQNRYFRHNISISPPETIVLSNVNSVSTVFSSTGTFYSQCIQPNSSISTWGTLSCAQTLVGAGSEVFYATSAATCAALPTTAPNTWNTSVTNNATLSVATNTAVRYGWRSLLGSATDQAQIDACTLSWNEGSPTQPAWAVYDSIKNSIYWTTTINGAASANRLLKYDRNLEQWYPFDIPAQAPRFINNNLYFGGASAGTWNQYGLVDSDAGASINAYWKSKDIGADSPFQAKSFKTLSILSRNQGTGSMTGTWTLSNAQTDSYTISLSTGTGIIYAQSNYNLPLVSPQPFINVKVGNNSSTPFEVLGLGLTWATQPWTVTP